MPPRGRRASRPVVRGKRPSSTSPSRAPSRRAPSTRIARRTIAPVAESSDSDASESEVTAPVPQGRGRPIKYPQLKNFAYRSGFTERHLMDPNLKLSSGSSADASSLSDMTESSDDDVMEHAPPVTGHFRALMDSSNPLFKYTRRADPALSLAPPAPAPHARRAAQAASAASASAAAPAATDSSDSSSDSDKPDLVSSGADSDSSYYGCFASDGDDESSDSDSDSSDDDSSDSAASTSSSFVKPKNYKRNCAQYRRFSRVQIAHMLQFYADNGGPGKRGNLKAACEKFNVPRRTFSRWVEESQDGHFASYRKTPGPKVDPEKRRELQEIVLTVVRENYGLRLRGLYAKAREYRDENDELAFTPRWHTFRKIISELKIVRRTFRFRHPNSESPKTRRRRAAFAKAARKWNDACLFYLDETGSSCRNKKIMYYEVRGAPEVTLLTGDGLKENVTTIMCIGVTGVIASHSVLGSVNALVFKDFFLRLAAELRKICPDQTPILVLDNARIHHAKLLQRAMKNSGISIRYLPPYSPPLNPIENLFAKMKRMINDKWLEKPPDNRLEAVRLITGVVDELTRLTRETKLNAYYAHMRKQVDTINRGGEMSFDLKEIHDAEKRMELSKKKDI